MNTNSRLKEIYEPKHYELTRKFTQSSNYCFKGVDAPFSPGVYLIFKTFSFSPNKTHKRELLYIGSTKNLRQRLTHHKVIKNLRLKGLNVDLFYMETCNYIEIEKQLINHYQPKLNIIHKYENLNA